MALVPAVFVFVEELNVIDVSSLDDSIFEHGPACRWEEQSEHARPKYPCRRLSISGNNPKSEPLEVVSRGDCSPPSRPMRKSSLCCGNVNEKYEHGPSDRASSKYGKVSKHSVIDSSGQTLPVPGQVPSQSGANRRQRLRAVASIAA